MDFDDLLVNTVALFREHPDVLEAYRQRFQHVLVDEYQDTNVAQNELVLLLAGGHGNVTVVGDGDQSIYRFRGADLRNIVQFEDAFPEGVTTIVLDQNYRSTQTILDAANAVIANNVERKPKHLWTDAGSGDRIVRYWAEDENDEARFVAATAHDLRNTDAVNWREIAVLYRTNAQSRVIEESLMRSGVPYKVVGGTRYYDRREIRDAMAYLRAVVNPADEVSVKRILNVPKRGIGDTSVDKLDRYAATTGRGFVDALRHAETPESTGPAQRGIASFVTLLDSLAARLDERNGRSGRAAAGRPRGFGLSGRAGGRGHRRGPRTIGEPRRADRFGPRVHEGRRVPRAGVARRRHRRAPRRRGRGPGRPADAALGEGPRVPGRVPRRRRGRRLPEQPGAERARRHGGGAAPRLCRHHPGAHRLFISHAWSRSLYGTTTYNPPSRFLEEIPDELVDPQGNVSGRTSYGRQSLRGRHLARDLGSPAAVPPPRA